MLFELLDNRSLRFLDLEIKTLKFAFVHRLLKFATFLQRGDLFLLEAFALFLSLPVPQWYDMVDLEQPSSFSISL
tara:strand:- start:189 stop:413 length:225 start_codon:yes stop_codon:yes gene_type:complete